MKTSSMYGLSLGIQYIARHGSFMKLAAHSDRYIYEQLRHHFVLGSSPEFYILEVKDRVAMAAHLSFASTELSGVFLPSSPSTWLLLQLAL